jgi:hypothetical protein
MTGIQIKGYNDIEERDVESYHEVAIKKETEIKFSSIYFKT